MRTDTSRDRTRWRAVSTSTFTSRCAQTSALSHKIPSFSKFQSFCSSLVHQHKIIPPPHLPIYTTQIPCPTAHPQETTKTRQIESIRNPTCPADSQFSISPIKYLQNPISRDLPYNSAISTISELHVTSQLPATHPRDSKFESISTQQPPTFASPTITWLPKIPQNQFPRFGPPNKLKIRFQTRFQEIDPMKHAAYNCPITRPLL